MGGRPRLNGRVANGSSLSTERSGTWRLFAAPGEPSPTAGRNAFIPGGPRDRACPPEGRLDGGGGAYGAASGVPEDLRRATVQRGRERRSQANLAQCRTPRPRPPGHGRCNGSPGVTPTRGALPEGEYGGFTVALRLSEDRPRAAVSPAPARGINLPPTASSGILASVAPTRSGTDFTIAFVCWGTRGGRSVSARLPIGESTAGLRLRLHVLGATSPGSRRWHPFACASGAASGPVMPAATSSPRCEWLFVWPSRWRRVPAVHPTAYADCSPDFVAPYLPLGVGEVRPLTPRWRSATCRGFPGCAGMRAGATPGGPLFPPEKPFERELHQAVCRVRRDRVWQCNSRAKGAGHGCPAPADRHGCRMRPARGEERKDRRARRPEHMEAHPGNPEMGAGGTNPRHGRLTAPATRGGGTHEHPEQRRSSRLAAVLLDPPSSKPGDGCRRDEPAAGSSRWGTSCRGQGRAIRAASMGKAFEIK